MTSTDDSALVNEDGHLNKGVSVSGKRELHELLSAWFQESGTPTIGDIGSYGGSPCVIIRLDEETTAVLNADTTRPAVKEYLDDARMRGVDAEWLVIPNQNGRLNKVVFDENGEATPGWYCYLRYPNSGSPIL